MQRCFHFVLALETPNNRRSSTSRHSLSGNPDPLTTIWFNLSVEHLSKVRGIFGPEIIFCLVVAHHCLYEASANELLGLSFIVTDYWDL